VCLLKKMSEVPVSDIPVWLTGRWDGLEMGGLQDKETAKASQDIEKIKLLSVGFVVRPCVRNSYLSKSATNQWRCRVWKYKNLGLQ
jgi:hypothetical protein